MLATNVDDRDCTIRDALRVHTHDVHHQLHEHSHFVALFDGTIGRSQYRALMKSFHGYYASLEQAIYHAVSQTAFGLDRFDYPERLNFLAQDLADLGYSSEEIDHNPRCTAIVTAVTPASLAGVLYVIEGSTLGAAQIDRAAQRILSSDTTQGRNFWAWSRAHNKIRWAAINAYLAHLEDTGHQKETIIQGANDTFQALADWLAPLEQPPIPLKVTSCEQKNR